MNIQFRCSKCKVEINLCIALELYERGDWDLPFGAKIRSMEYVENEAIILVGNCANCDSFCELCKKGDSMIKGMVTYITRLSLPRFKKYTKFRGSLNKDLCYP